MRYVGGGVAGAAASVLMAELCFCIYILCCTSGRKGPRAADRPDYRITATADSFDTFLNRAKAPIPFSGNEDLYHSHELPWSYR